MRLFAKDDYRKSKRLPLAFFYYNKNTRQLFAVIFSGYDLLEMKWLIYFLYHFAKDSH